MKTIKPPVVDEDNYSGGTLFKDANGECYQPDDIAAALNAALAARKTMVRENEEICQILGKALGYPWYKDDKKNFPGATEANGVCVGDHVAVTLAMEAAHKIATQTWQPITEDAVKGKGFLLLLPTVGLKAQAPVIAELIVGRHGDLVWYDHIDTSYDFGCFDGFMPLPPMPGGEAK